MKRRVSVLIALFIFASTAVALGYLGYLFLYRTEEGKSLRLGPAYFCPEYAQRACGDRGIKDIEFSGDWLRYRCRFECDGDETGNT